MPSKSLLAFENLLFQNPSLIFISITFRTERGFFFFLKCSLSNHVPIKVPHYLQNKKAHMHWPDIQSPLQLSQSTYSIVYS